MDDLAAVVLAAGAGTRLRPLTTVRPKALCPVANVPLVDHAIARARTVTDRIAVNVHHGRNQMVAHLSDVFVSIEEPEALGTAGAIGALKPWIDGRDVLVLNADSWHREGVVAFVREWDRNRVRLLAVVDASRPDFDGRLRYAGAALIPGARAGHLEPVPSGLYEEVFRPALDEGRLEFVVSDVPFFDCGTPADYLAANLAATGGRSVVGEGARVEGIVTRSVVWPGAAVGPHEHLVDAIRASDDVTISVDHVDRFASLAPASPTPSGGTVKEGLASKSDTDIGGGS